MTIGEKIRAYRERLNVTQAELEELLSVDSGIVGLWEDGTLRPTIGELAKLKKALGVSADALIDDNQTVRIVLEHYSFTFKKNELDTLQKFLQAGALRRGLVIVLVYLAALLLFSYIKTPIPVIAFIVLTAIVAVASVLKKRRRRKKTGRKLTRRPAENIIEYSVYSDGFEYSSRSDGELLDFRRIAFSSVDRVIERGEYLIIYSGDTVMFARRSEIKNSSRLIKRVKRVKRSRPIALPEGRVKIISVLLALVAVAGLLIGFGLAERYLLNAFLPMKHLWTLMLPIALPVACVAWALYLRKNDLKYKANLIIGGVMMVVVMLFSVALIRFANDFKNYDMPLQRAEHYMRTEFPEPYEITAYALRGDACGAARESDHYVSYMSFDEASAARIEAMIASDKRWLAELPTALSRLAYDQEKYDFTIIIDPVSNEFNVLPSRVGIHHFIELSYSLNERQLRIAEYDREYR